MNVVLIGYRGTGKSSVAELVGLTLGYPVFHMDDEIVRMVGCSIPEFVEQHGWEAFAELESRVVASTAQLRNTVVDSGGGVVRRAENMELLKQHGRLFWLKADVGTIKDRLRQEESSRPPLTEGASPIDEVEHVLYARLPVYAQYADYVIDTAGRTLSEIADEIANIVCS